MALFNSIQGEHVPDPIVTARTGIVVRTPAIRIPLKVILLWKALKAIGIGIYLYFRFWWITIPVTSVFTIYFRYDWLGLLVVGLVVGGVATLWWWRPARPWLLRLVGWPLKTRIRRLKLNRQWIDAMQGAGLAANRGGQQIVPELRKLVCRSYVETLTVRMLAGQLPEDFAKVSLRLAHAFGARHVKVSASKRMDEVILSFLHGDRLARVVRPFAITASPQFTALPLALRENGETWTLRLFGNQVLVIGATDAGKGSVAWSFIRALAGGIASGLVHVWAFDPKGGMELAAGAPMFTRFLCEKYDEMADALEEAVALMRERTYRLRGKTRQHTPSLAEPLIVILIDELAALTAYGPDKSQRERIKNALALILTQGRAVGVHVIALAQDARKEAVPNRDLFTVRIGLRMNEASQVDLVLDDQAINRGAMCHRIPKSTPGVAYVIDETQPTAERIRFSYPTDADIDAMARTYARAGVIDGQIIGGHK